MPTITLRNSYDLAQVRAGQLRFEEARCLHAKGIVDTGATMLVIPEEVAAFLGLPHVGHRRIRLADGRIRSFRVVGDLVIEILGRSMSSDAVVMPIGTTILIGQVVLAVLDLLVNCKTGAVTVNPDHPDGPLLDALSAACYSPWPPCAPPSFSSTSTEPSSPRAASVGAPSSALSTSFTASPKPARSFASTA